MDYDGTLSPIVDCPDRAFMADEMRAIVGAVAAKFVTAIVTGRSYQKVYEFVKLDGICKCCLTYMLYRFVNTQQTTRGATGSIFTALWSGLFATVLRRP